jgi:hypothetical protein
MRLQFLPVANVTLDSTNHDQFPVAAPVQVGVRHSAVDMTSDVAEKYRAPEAVWPLVFLFSLVETRKSQVAHH